MTGTGITDDGCSESDYVAGVHVPSGRRYSAVDAAADPAVKSGPWVCAADGCDVPLVCRRYAPVSSGGQRPETRGATFACWPGTKHNPAVAHPTPRRIHGNATAATRPVEIHRVIDLPTEPTPPKQAALGGSAASRPRTRTPYAADVSGVAGLLAESEVMKATPDLGLRKQFRLSGRTYWWHELAYQSTDSGFARLDRVIGSVFGRFGTEFYVEGILPYRVYPTESGEFLHLRLTSALPLKEPVVHAFMPNRPEFVEWVGAWRQGTAVALFSNEVTTHWRMRGLFLQRPDQVMCR